MSLIFLVHEYGADNTQNKGQNHKNCIAKRRPLVEQQGVKVCFSKGTEIDNSKKRHEKSRKQHKPKQAFAT